MNRTNPWIQTYTGKKFFLRNPQPHMIHMADIAWALPKLQRFTGHARTEFYSVAEHCIWVRQRAGEIVKGAGGDEHAVQTAQRWGLAHDMMEAYYGDMSGPLKLMEEGAPDWAGSQELRRVFQPYIDMEAEGLAALAQKLRLPLPIPAAVIQADQELLAEEAAHLMRAHGEVKSLEEWGLKYRHPIDNGTYCFGWDPEEWPGRSDCWNPARARKELVAEIIRLFPHVAEELRQFTAR